MSHKKYLIKAIAWVLVIAVLLPSIVLIGIYTYYPFQLPSDEIPNPKEEPLVYELQTRNDFKALLNNFLKIGIFPLGDAALEQLSSFFLTAFSRARIPPEQVLAFGQYLADNGAGVSSYIEKLLGYLALADEQQPLGQGADGLTFYNELTIIVSAMAQMLAECNFSIEQTGKVYYELLYQIGDTQYHKALVELGKEGFITLYNSINTALSLKTLDFSSDISQTDLEQMRSAFYQVGSDYIKLYNRLGDNAIETVLGTKFLFLSAEDGEIDNEEIELYNQTIQSLDGLASFSLLVFSEFSKQAGNDFYSNVAEYAKEGCPEYAILAALQGARSAEVALGAAFGNQKNEKIKDRQSLVNAYANAYKSARNLIAWTREQEEYTIDHSQDIEDYLDIIYGLSQDYTDINTTEDIEKLTPEKQEDLFAKAALLTQIDEQVLLLPQELSGILLFNILLEITDVREFLLRLAQEQAV